MSEQAIIPVGKIENRILLIRGVKVIMDADLAEFYGVPTKRLNEQVKRNRGRFPKDFMFQLTPEEKSEVVAKCDHLSKLKFTKAMPYGFTEHGAIMAASVLNSKRAIEVSVFFVRAFMKLRKTIAEHRELATKLSELERRLASHDQQILHLVNAIRQLTSPSSLPSTKRIGFIAEKD
jgi:phage regulator Rha-like protein